MSEPRTKNIRLQTIDDCRRLLQKTVNEFKGKVIDEAHARCLGYLVKIMIDCIKDGEIEARLEALEKLMNREEKPWPA